MAIEKIIEIKVNADQANKSLNQTEKDLNKVGTASSQAAENINKTNKSLKDITNSSDDVGKKLKDLDAVVATTPKNFKELGKQIQAYQTIALQAGRESAVGREALKNAAALKDQMVDLQNETKRLADDNKNLQGALGIGTGVLAGFTAYQGALGMIGVESEDLQKTMVKLQAAQSALSGIVQLQTAFQKESAAMLLINTARTKVATAIQWAYNVAMSANPIGAIIAAIALLIAGITALIMNFKAITDWLGITDSSAETLHKNNLARNKKEQELQDKKLKDLAKEKDELGKKHSFQERLMKAQGKSEEEIFKAIQKNRLERAKAAEEFARQTVIKNDLLTAEFNLLKANGDLTKEEADRINAAITENNKIINDSNNEARALVEEIRLDDVAKATAAENKKTEAVKEANEKQAEIRKKAQEKKEADEKAAREKEIADEKARLAKQAQDQAELLAQISQLEDDYLNSKISKEQQEVNAVQDKYNAIIEAARLANEDITILEEAREREEQAIRDKFLKERTDKELAAQQELQQQLFDLQADSVQKTLDGLDISRDAELLKLQEKLDAKLITQEQFEQAQAAIIANFTAQTDKVKKDADDADLARNATAADQNLQLASDSLGAISKLVTAFAGESEAAQRKAFNINKAISIGQAIISTAQGVIAQLAVPQDALTGANFVKAGIVAATGAAQIATISRTQFKGGGTPAPPPNAPTTAQSQPANFNVVGNTGTNQLADTLGSSPMKAYVVAGDVTSAQSLERNKIQQSTL
jgi:hypothetical protein